MNREEMDDDGLYDFLCEHGLVEPDKTYIPKEVKDAVDTWIYDNFYDQELQASEFRY